MPAAMRGGGERGFVERGISRRPKISAAEVITIAIGVKGARGKTNVTPVVVT